MSGCRCLGFISQLFNLRISSISPSQRNPLTRQSTKSIQYPQSQDPCHSPGGWGKNRKPAGSEQGGLVQHIFSAPSRLRRPDLLAATLAARRHAKNALHSCKARASLSDIFTRDDKDKNSGSMFLIADWGQPSPLEYLSGCAFFWSRRTPDLGQRGRRQSTAVKSSPD